MFTWLGRPFRTAPSNIDESIQPGEKPRDYVRRLASEKVMVEIQSAKAGDIIVAADTIVVRDEDILGKPVDARAAFEMLELLRNRTHQVITALSLRMLGSPDILQDVCASNVRMRPYARQEIEAYVSSGDPFDKAGGYAIQNSGFDPVVNFAGCFASVMGMPLCHLERTLRKLPGYESCDMAAVCQKNLKYQCPITNRVMSGEDIG